MLKRILKWFFGVLALVLIAGAIFLILELNSPYEGFMRISDVPLRNALAMVDK